MSKGPSQTSYHERLTIPISWWLLTLGFASTLVVAVGAYLNLQFGAAVAVLCLLVIGIAFWSYGHVVVAADASGLRAGSSRIEWPWVADVEVLDAAQVRQSMGPGSLASGWFLTRPYVKGAVRVTLDDPADPHPFWLVSARHPERLAAVARQHLMTEAGEPGR
ncbi:MULTISPECIES: DUF3093 domain-containing protein [unclassified Luteococcus]|uniref:DUF3093 domain-containing protein n=1 Tax=unclassified Luteococcus TaxID=2639923 RepID=UPI00313E5404